MKAITKILIFSLALSSTLADITISAASSSPNSIVIADSTESGKSIAITANHHVTSHSQVNQFKNLMYCIPDPQEDTVQTGDTRVGFVHAYNWGAMMSDCTTSGDWGSFIAKVDYTYDTGAWGGQVSLSVMQSNSTSGASAPGMEATTIHFDSSEQTSLNLDSYADKSFKCFFPLDSSVSDSAIYSTSAEQDISGHANFEATTNVQTAGSGSTGTTGSDESSAAIAQISTLAALLLILS